MSTGYGICTDGIQYKTTVPRVKEMLRLAPGYYAEHEDIIDSYEDDDDVSDLITELADENYCCGLADVMASVIEEAENIRLVCVRSCEDENYLLFEPFYPWQAQTHEEAALGTTEKADILFRKYCRVLSDDKVNPAEETVELDD